MFRGYSHSYRGARSSSAPLQTQFGTSRNPRVGDAFPGSQKLEHVAPMMVPSSVMAYADSRVTLAGKLIVTVLRSTI